MKKHVLLLVLLIAAPVFKSQADEKDLYDFLWLDQDKKVYVLQNKLFHKARSVYIDLGYAFTQTGEYQSTSAIQGTLGYHFKEEWALEFLYNSYSNSDNEPLDQLRTINSRDPFIRRINSSMGLLGIWSPFYGKINTFNKIIYFDWSFGAGVAKIEGESNKDTVASGVSSFRKESYTGAMFKSALKVNVTEHFHVKIQYLNTIYSAPGPTINGRVGEDKFRSNSDIILGVGFSF